MWGNQIPMSHSHIAYFDASGHAAKEKVMTVEGLSRHLRDGSASTMSGQRFYQAREFVVFT